jgi:hypothetical protein
MLRNSDTQTDSNTEADINSKMSAASPECFIILLSENLETGAKDTACTFSYTTDFDCLI